MLMMRLQRIGRKNDPSYRVVVVDKRTSTKSNKNIDTLGFYNPKLGEVQIDGDKAKAWLQKGVQASGTVHNMLVTKKIIEAKKINVLPKKTPPPAPVKEEVVKDEASVASAETPTDAPVEEPAETTA